MNIDQFEMHEYFTRHFKNVSAKQNKTNVTTIQTKSMNKTKQIEQKRKDINLTEDETAQKTNNCLDVYLYIYNLIYIQSDVTVISDTNIETL